jgi:1-deoxy-D-xylulose 5-phosphate reductoisomerase
MAVAAFLSGNIRYTDIVRLNIRAIESIIPNLPIQPQMDALLDLDLRTRSILSEWIKELQC